MIARKPTERALDLVWEAMVELTERVLDDVVSTQRKPSGLDAQRIARRASQLSLLAHAASLLARYLNGGGR